jgi:hypothetical protein
MKLYFNIESNNENINKFSQIIFIEKLTTVLLKILTFISIFNYYLNQILFGWNQMDVISMVE